MKNKLFLIFFLCVTTSVFSQSKKLVLPFTIWMVPADNNFNDTTSKYNFKYHKESPNLAIFWSRKFGIHPERNTSKEMRFNVDSILSECERFYQFYRDSLHFVQSGHSVSDSTKVILIVFDEDDGTAYGGDSGDSLHIGMLWTPPMRINQYPFGTIAHELGHVFQSFVSADGGVGFQASPSMYEMTSQYMLWQTYPHWLDFENYHLKAFLDQTYLSFLHEDNMYHSPFVLEFWSEKYGKTFIGELWRSAQKGEDAVMTFKRLRNLTQSQFNDSMFDACRHFVNWNLPRIQSLAKPYANAHYTKLQPQANHWYQIDTTDCPQNYGYNAIPLRPLTNKVSLHFEGLENVAGFRAIKSNLSGWRYGFVAETEDGKSFYSSVYKERNGKYSFPLPKKTKHLWLVVMGAPTKHWTHVVNGKKEDDEQWPYRFQLKGAAVISSK